MHRSRKWPLAAFAAGVLFAARRARARGFFRGKVVLVTGGSRGLGLVLARELARRGARLAICARDAAEVEHARAELAAPGAEVLGLTCDVSQEPQARAAVEQTLQRYGRLDVLCNNAGVIQIGPLESMGLADFRQAMETNYFGMLHMTLAALPHLRRRRSGNIVNICSIGGAIAIPHLLPYVASKYAAVGFSEGLAAEAARDGVRVSTILPFVMRTGSHVNALFKGQRGREFTWFATGASLPGSSVPAGRAARRILRACALGEPYVSIGLLAGTARVLHALAPGLVIRALGLANRLLPAPGGAGVDEPGEPGWLHRPAAARSGLLKLGDEAARRNREVPWAPPA